MKIVYSGENAPQFFSKSIFLAGPTPRSEKTESWRPDALKILKNLKYDGVVFVPEFRNFLKKNMPENWTYEKQCEWEHKCLDMADIILFWIPRKLRTMPALTTNIEFGLYANSGKIVLGAPKNAHKMRYFKFMSEKIKIPYFVTLEHAVSNALNIIGKGSERHKGECSVPLNIWKTKSFQNWYASQKKQNNELKEANAISAFHKVGPNKDIVWGWVMRPNIYINEESRHKLNDPIIARTDISSVILIKKEQNPLNSKIVLVREFRSAVSNKNGFILEAPSGSSHDPNEDTLSVAKNELEEETGFAIEKSRLKRLGSRQLAATFAVHKAHAYFAEITGEELDWFSKQEGVLRINDKEETGERLSIQIQTIAQLLQNELLDWSNIGMILSVLTK